MLMGERFVSNCLENKKDVPLAIKTAASKTLALKGFIKTLYSKKGFLESENGKALLNSYPDSIPFFISIFSTQSPAAAYAINFCSERVDDFHLCHVAVYID